MRKGLWTMVFLAAGVCGAFAQSEYYLRGEFNSWGLADPMVNMGGGVYKGIRSNLTPGSLYNFKVANADWSQNGPGSDCRTAADAAGNLTVYMYSGFPFGDGWSPDSGWWRIGYDDPGQFGWDIMGSFNGWGAPVLSLSNMGSGLYSGDLAIAPGDYEFKFRKAGDWDVSIGGDFGNSAGNATLHVGAGDPKIRFQLDLPQGRWKTSVVPEPASFAGILAGIAIIAAKRRRK